jgi:hypothetical protein
MKFITLKEQNQSNAGTSLTTVNADHILTMRRLGSVTRVRIGPHMFLDVLETPAAIAKLIAEPEPTAAPAPEVKDGDVTFIELPGNLELFVDCTGDGVLELRVRTKSGARPVGVLPIYLSEIEENA